MHEFLVCTYNSQDFAQTQENVARLHDPETVTFRNSGLHNLWFLQLWRCHSVMLKLPFTIFIREVAAMINKTWNLLQEKTRHGKL